MLRDQIRGEIAQLEDLQKELQKVQEARSRFIQQQQENVMVLEEMALLPEDANVFKLVGPALIKQDPIEAKSNVETRLDLIKSELGRLEGQAKNIEEKKGQKEQQIIRLQEQAQRQSQAVQ